jgi:hypothetical protein
MLLCNSAGGILSVNEQMINFFILYSADGSGQKGVLKFTRTTP